MLHTVGGTEAEANNGPERRTGFPIQDIAAPWTTITAERRLPQNDAHTAEPRDWTRQGPHPLAGRVYVKPALRRRAPHHRERGAKMQYAAPADRTVTLHPQWSQERAAGA
jgi:hypothetical protein